MISLSAELGLWARGQEGQQPELAGRGGQDTESQALSPTPQAPGGEGLGRSRPIVQERARSNVPGFDSLRTLTFPLEAAHMSAPGLSLRPMAPASCL